MKKITKYTTVLAPLLMTLICFSNKKGIDIELTKKEHLLIEVYMLVFCYNHYIAFLSG